jgi:hypothetical protein
MQDDICGCRVSLTDEDALTSWNGVVLGILSHGQSAGDHLGNLLERAPDFAMGHAMKGLACLMLGRREVIAAAYDASAKAQAALAMGGATPREQLWCSALQDWLAGKATGAIASMEAAMALNPADTISMKLSHGSCWVTVVACYDPCNVHCPHMGRIIRFMVTRLDVIRSLWKKRVITKAPNASVCARCSLPAMTLGACMLLPTFMI